MRVLISDVSRLKINCIAVHVQEIDVVNTIIFYFQDLATVLVYERYR